jgi:hypothetical protein
MNRSPSAQSRNPQLWLGLSLLSLALAATAWIIVALLARQVLP